MIDKLKVAISENDVEKARRVMKNELLNTDYPHEVFTDAIELASAYGVFESHDNEKLLADPKEWDEKYLEKLNSGLDKNFSKERFIRAYYATRKIEKNKFNTIQDESCSVSVYDEYKSFHVLAQIGAGVIGAVAVGVGIWLYKRKKRK